MRPSQAAFSASLLIGSAALLACGDSVCDPGATQSCLCVGGASGVQSCTASGDVWGACDCSGGDRDAGPGTDGGPAADTGTPVGDAGGDPDAGPPEVCAFETCAGDPVGSWETDTACLSPRTSSCDGLVWSNQTLTWPQTLGIRADGTYEWVRMAGRRTADLVVSAACLPASVTTCADYPGRGLTTGTYSCTGDATVECRCTWFADLLGSSVDTGTWTVVGDVLELTNAEATIAPFLFCQRGGWLHMRPDDGSGSATGPSILFTRR